MPPKQASAPYAVDERVFCFHMDMLYEARILDVQQASAATGEKGSSTSTSTSTSISTTTATTTTNPENRWRYRIHYKGWKNTWDDWVPQDRVRKFNDENRELAAQLREQARQLQQQKNAKLIGKKTGGPGSEYGPGGPFGPGGPSGDRPGAGGPSGSGGPGSGTGTATPGERGNHLHHHPLHHHLDRHHDLSTSARGSEERTGGGTSVSHARGPRRQRDYELEHEESFHNRPSIRLTMPDHLKAALVDDWENVTKNQQLVPLPHKMPVEVVLDDYLAFERPHREEGSASLDILEETVAGLREYFNKCLGRILLYRFERPQYLELHEMWETDGTYKSPVETYGAEHLCRLLVSLPELIAQTNMDQQSVNRLREELTKLTSWLGKNMVKYFVSEYETPNGAYAEKVRGL